MTNKTTPKLTAAQERAWEYIQAWYAQPDHAETFYSGRTGRGVTIHAVPVGKNTLEALWNKGMVKHAERKPWQPLLYTIHPNYIPTVEHAAPTPEPAPAAAPAPMSNAPVYHTVLLPDTFADFQAREDIEIVHQSKDPDGLIRLAYRVKATAQPAPVEPEGAPLTGERREVFDALVASYEARIAALETELAEENADLEATAIRETQLAKRITELERENANLRAVARDACAEYGGDFAEDAMHMLADTIGYPWN